MISKKTVKVVCLNVVPGHELYVMEEFRKACDRFVGGNRWAVYKGFGEFDVFVFYETDGFDYKLTGYGSIKHIVKYNQQLCYCGSDEEHEAFFEQLQTATFIGTTYIKLNMNRLCADSKDRVDCLSKLNTSAGSTMLRALGWYELMLVTVNDTVKDILNSIVEMSEMDSNEDSYALISKTNSYLAINANKLPSSAIVSEGVDSIKKHLKQYSTLNRNVDGVNFAIDISLPTAYYKDVIDFWPDEMFDKTFILGTKDIRISPNCQVSWADLLGYLFHFRRTENAEVISTNTAFNLTKDVKNETAFKANPPIDWSELFNVMDSIIDDSDFKKDKQLYSEVVNNVYSFVNVVQNPSTAFAYIDVINYIGRIKVLIDDYKRVYASNKDTEEAQRVIRGALTNINEGVRVRSYGLYENFEGSYSTHNRVRGGIHQVLNGLRYIPDQLIHDYDSWAGFINISNNKFYHFDHVLTIPHTSVLNVTHWWAIYHEIAHILIYKNIVRLHFDIPVVRDYIRNKNKFAEIELLHELFAETIGFLLLFNGNFVLFRDSLWLYLADIQKKQPEVPIDFYLLRTVFVQMFHLLVDEKVITKTDFVDRDFIFALYKETASEIQKFLSERGKSVEFESVRYSGAYAAQCISQLYNIALYLNKEISDVGKKLGCPLRKKFSPGVDNSVDVAKAILAGSIYAGKIDSFEHVLNIVLEHNQNNQIQNVVQVSIAAIESLKYNQISRYSDGLKTRES